MSSGSDQSASFGLSSFDDTPPPTSAPAQRGPTIWSAPVTPGAANVPVFAPVPPGAANVPVFAPVPPGVANVPVSPSRQGPSTPRFREPERRPDLPTPAEEPELADQSWVDNTFIKKLRDKGKVYENIANTNDIPGLRNFVKTNAVTMIWGEYAFFKFKDLVDTFATEEQKRWAAFHTYRFDVLINIIRDILENCQRNMAVMDISYSGPKDAEGLEKAIEKARRKMTDVIADLQFTVKKQEDEIAIMKDNLLYMDELRAELVAARRGVTHYLENVPPEVEFMQDLQYRLDLQENMNSSLVNELEDERRSKQEIFNQYLQAEAKRMRDQQELMSEIAAATKHFEMQEVIRDGITAKIKTLTANPAEVAQAVDEWIKVTLETLEQKKKEVQRLTAEGRNLGFTMGYLETERDERKKRIKEAEAALENMAQEILEIEGDHEVVRDIGEQKLKRKSYISLLKERQEGLAESQRDEEEKLEREKQMLFNWEHQMKRNLKSRYMDMMREDVEERKKDFSKLGTVFEEESERTPPRHAKYMIKKGSSKRVLTPEQYQRLTPTMRTQLEQPKKSLPPFLLDRYFEPMGKSQMHMQAPSPSHLAQPIGILRTSPSSFDKYFEPMEESPVQPSPLSQSSVSPSRSIPAVTITPPGQTEPSVRIESPIVITTPPETTLVSKSRFSYTDPSMPLKEVNIPPGPFEVETSFRKTIVLSSPKRAEPLLVNMVVDPKPLIDTEYGESFVCDISLDVQPGGHDILPLPQERSGAFLDERDRSPERSHERSLEVSYSPVIKGRRIGRYNIPPDITPTTTRRHGLFTPRGIFKKRQVNIRRIPGEYPIPELPWSPIYLPEDARSPVSSFLPSPHWSDWSDRTVSWEKSPGSPSPVIKRSIYRDSLPDSDLSSSSPVIKGQFYRDSSPDSDLSSSSPVIKGPFYRDSSPDSYLSSSSPVIKGPSYGYRSSESDRSSPSPRIRSFRGDQLSEISSPIYASPPSGYISELEQTNSPQSFRTHDYRPEGAVQLDDPLNRRTWLNELIRTPERYVSPRLPRTSDRYSSPNGTYGSDYVESEGDYLEGSLNDSSLLDESRFL